MNKLATIAAAIAALGLLGVSANADSNLAAKRRADAAAAAAHARMHAADSHRHSKADVAAHKDFWSKRHADIKANKDFWQQRRAKIARAKAAYAARHHH